MPFPSVKHRLETLMAYLSEFGSTAEQFIITIYTPFGDPPNKHLTINQGGNYVKRVSVVDINYGHFDTINRYIQGEIKDDFGGTSIRTINEGNGLIVNRLNGIFDIVIPPYLTELLDFDVARYDFEMVFVVPAEIPFAGGFTSLALLLDWDAGGHGKITANGGTPFSAVVIGDKIRLTDCENPTNDRTYEVLTRTDTVLTFTTALGIAGFDGVDNAADTSVTIELLVSAEVISVIKLFQGTVRLNKEITE